ncbi:MAG: hypothetical protein R2762_20690 [Bryobacteraceae bacterium]
MSCTERPDLLVIREHGALSGGQLFAAAQREESAPQPGDIVAIRPGELGRPVVMLES